MIPLRNILLTIASLAVASGAAPAQEVSRPDRELAVLEGRLQELRAGAMRSRLTLYLDELEKLHGQFTAAGDIASIAAVQKEIDFATHAVKRLAAIATGGGEPAAADETKDGQALTGTALAERRIDAQLLRFSKAAADATSAAQRAAAAAGPRQHVLKIERASVKSGYGSGTEYWSYEGNYASWSLDGVTPGDYEVVLRFTAGPKSGGSAKVSAAGQSFNVTVPKGEKGQGRKSQEKSAGIVKVKESGVDIRVDGAGLADGANYLWDLQTVILQPAGRSP